MKQVTTLLAFLCLIFSCNTNSETEAEATKNSTEEVTEKADCNCSTSAVLLLVKFPTRLFSKKVIGNEINFSSINEKQDIYQYIPKIYQNKCLKFDVTMDAAYFFFYLKFENCYC